MKRKGFTLIELLAVIVILAIIAVITVPKIADMITSSRQGGAEDSFYGTLKAAELGYTKALQSNTNLKGSTCTIENSKITCTNGVEINVSGKTPESGTLTIDSSGSTMAKALTLNGYKCYGDLSTENPCVKANIDVASETLIKKVTTSGDGLYKDLYDETRYVYKGTNPNNYLTFNNEEAGWRIVSVENDGTIKIIRDEKVVDKAFDSRTTNTTGHRLNSNNTYCKLSSDGKYFGCNAWSAVNGTYVNDTNKGTVTVDSTLKTYLNIDYYNSLKSDSKNKIQAHQFYKGGVLINSNFEEVIKSEQKDSWDGNIGLLNGGDFLKASTNSSCSSSTPLFEAPGGTHTTYSCSNDNYLYKSAYYWWLLSPRSDNTYYVLIVNRTGYFGSQPFAYGDGAVRPVMYLKANIELIGSGTESDPYKIK